MGQELDWVGICWRGILVVFVRFVLFYGLYESHVESIVCEFVGGIPESLP